MDQRSTERLDQLDARIADVDVDTPASGLPTRLEIDLDDRLREEFCSYPRVQG